MSTKNTIRNENIYEAIWDDGAFHNLPNIFSSAVDGRSSVINWVHSTGEFINFTYNYFSDSFMQSYINDYIYIDPWNIDARKDERKNKVYDVTSYVSPSHWERSDIYNQLVLSNGDDTFYCVGGPLYSEWGIGIFGVNRGKGAGAFGADAAKALESGAEALRRVLMVRGEIATHQHQAGLARSMLDIVGVAVICVGQGQDILHANEAADALLRRGLGVYVKNGVLKARSEMAQRQMEAAVAGATASFQPKTATFVIPRLSEAGAEALSAYQVTAVPLAKLSGPSKALLVFKDPDAREPTLLQRVKAFYRLTNAEAEMAVALSEWLSLAEIASRRAVQEATVRSQVKSLSAKMNCNRQTQIALAVANLPLLWTDRSE